MEFNWYWPDGRFIGKVTLNGFDMERALDVSEGRRRTYKGFYWKKAETLGAQGI